MFFEEHQYTGSFLVKINIEKLMENPQCILLPPYMNA